MCWDTNLEVVIAAVAYEASQSLHMFAYATRMRNDLSADMKGRTPSRDISRRRHGTPNLPSFSKHSCIVWLKLKHAHQQFRM